MQRRDFIFGGLAALAIAPRLVAAKAYALPPRSLYLHHTHTNESLEINYLPGGSVVKSSLQKLNHFLRDFRTEQTRPIDTMLFSMLYDIQRYSRNHDGVFEIISGYRSPETNAMLRRETEGVARHSKHQEGKALDIRLRGTPTSELKALALEMQCGGVGYYPNSDFVHIDTGDVRHW